MFEEQKKHLVDYMIRRVAAGDNQRKIAEECSCSMTFLLKAIKNAEKSGTIVKCPAVGRGSWRGKWCYPHELEEKIMISHVMSSAGKQH